MRSVLVVMILLACVVGVAQAGPITFNLTWSGASFGNGATATGQITFEETLLPNPGNYSGAMPPWVLDFTMTVSGAATGNGVFDLTDMGLLTWSTGGVALDLSRELVGQATTSSTWGSTNGSGGEFLVFGSSPAPSPAYFFTLATGGAKAGGTLLLLTSFAPANAIPEPGAFGLIGFGLLAIYAGLRRRSA